jgi:hypothetical protein
LTDKCTSVFTINRSSIKDSSGAGNILRDVLMKPSSDVSVSLLSLFWGGNLSGTNSPDWLVSNNNIAPLSLCKLVSNSLELSGIYFIGLAGLSLLKELTNADHDVHAVLDCNLGLDSDVLIGLTEEGSSLGVTSKSPLDANISELVSSDISSVSTSSILGYILSRNIDLLVSQ